MPNLLSGIKSLVFVDGWQRLQRASWLLILTIIVVNTGLVLILVSRRAYAPMTVENPSEISQATVTDFVEVQTYICLKAKDQTLVTFSRTFRSLDEPEGTLVPATSFVTQLDPGCRTTTFRYMLPTAVTAGEWILGGSIVAVGEHGESQAVVWYTSAFQVSHH